MESVKSYLLLAFISWCEDHGLTPMLTLQTKGSLLPDFLYQHDQINLNVSSAACLYFQVDHGVVNLTARFNGESFDVKIPIQNCLLIFSRENECIVDLESVFEGSAPLPNVDFPRRTKKTAPPAAMKIVWDAHQKTSKED